jgi:hypothetical protein
MVHADGQEDTLGAQPVRSYGRHGAVHTELPSLIGCGADDATAFGATADHDRLAFQFWSVPLLDGGIECVHVHVQNHDENQRMALPWFVQP